MPTFHGPVVLCDVGANVNCRDTHLLQYGIMSSIYIERLAGVANPREVLRGLQWGEGWIELLWRREQAQDDAEQRERTAIAFDMLAAVLEQPRFDAACKAVRAAKISRQIWTTEAVGNRPW